MDEGEWAQLVSGVHLCAHTHAFSAWAGLVVVACMLSLCVRDTSLLLHVQESSSTFQACMVQRHRCYDISAELACRYILVLGALTYYMRVFYAHKLSG